MSSLAPRIVLDAASAWLRHVFADPLAWQETRNKLAAFLHFQEAEHWWDGALTSSLSKAARLEPWARLWTLEGLGRILGERGLRVHESHGSRWHDGITEAALLCLHPGLGLSLAVEQLAQGEPLARRVIDFVERCGRLARPGWCPVLIEALGLASCTLHRGALAGVAAEVRREDPDWLSFFWHGVGRGQYFAQRDAATLSRAGDVPALASAASHGSARLNVVSGYAWALTLVNLRHPEIVRQATRRARLSRAERAAWSDGVSAAVRLWAGAIGRDRWLEGLLRHPGPREWREQVLEPCHAALQRRHAGPWLFGYAA